MRYHLGLVVGGTLLALASQVSADPPPAPLPDVFCFKITDIERPISAYTGDDPVNGDLIDDDRFLFEFEVLNWTDSFVYGVQLSLNTGTTTPRLSDAFIDRDGRGGSVGDATDPLYGEIDGQKLTGGGRTPDHGHADPIPHKHGRGSIIFGEPDSIENFNDWDVLELSPTTVTFDADIGFVNGDPFNNGFAIIPEDLLGGTGRVPGTGRDALGDSAIDGGPGCANRNPTVPGDCDDPISFDNGYYERGPDDSSPLVLGETPLCFDGPAFCNVVDGFVIEIDDFDVGDTLSFNWALLTLDADAPECIEPDVGGCLALIGGGFGSGVLNLTRLDGGDLPGPLFEGNTGFNQNPELFFDEVYDLPNPAGFAGEVGGGIVAAFMNEDDNRYGLVENTGPAASVPEPGALLLLGSGLLVIFAIGYWRNRRP